MGREVVAEVAVRVLDAPQHRRELLHHHPPPVPHLGTGGAVTSTPPRLHWSIPNETHRTRANGLIARGAPRARDRTLAATNTHEDAQWPDFLYPSTGISCICLHTPATLVN